MHIRLKSIVIVVATLVAGAVSVVPAFAAGISPIDSSVAGEGGYSDPVASCNPHGGYSTSSNKCRTCHAVHGAAAGGEALLRTPVKTPPSTYDPCRWCHSTTPDIGGDYYGSPAPLPPANTATEANPSVPCVYCHVSGPFAITKVYGGDPNNYWGESTAQKYLNNHASSHGFGQSGYEGCPSCHSVHGADVWSNAVDGVSFAKILRRDPGVSLAAPVDNMDDFCRDCHDGSGLNGAVPVQTGSWGSYVPWCGDGCHDSANYAPDGSHANLRKVGMVTKSGSRNGVSHVMTTTVTNAAGATVSQAGSQHCTSCHKGGNHTADNSFPHLTSGADFLTDTYTQTTHLDQVCLECHDDGVTNGAFGVGDSF